MNRLKRRILIVDDNHAIHGDFRKILGQGLNGSQPIEAAEAALFGDSAKEQTESSFELDFACQGQEALQMVCRAWNEGRPYMMAFIDVRMPPGWDGIETTAKIWEVDSYLQVVICTAYSDYSWKQVAATLNQPDRFVILRKPFDVVEVLQLANALTEKWLLLKQMEERTHKMRDSEKRYHFLADAMPGFVWTAKPDGRVDYANRRLQDFSGRTLEQNKDWGWQEMVHPEDRQNCQELWAAALRTGQLYQVEYRLKQTGDGGYRWFLGRGIPMRNEEGQIIQWIGTSIDIEDQKRAEAGLIQAQTDLEKRVAERTQELAAIRARLEHLLRSSPAIIYSVRLGAQEHVAFMSDNISQVLGYEPAEFTDSPRFWIEHLHPEDAAAMPGHRSKLLATGHHPIEYRFRHKDGSHRWMHDDARVIRDAQGNAAELVGSWVDVTERKRMEEALRRSEEHFRQIAENISEVFWMTSADWSQVLYISPAYEKIWGRTCASLYKQPASWFDAIHPDDRAFVRSSMEKKYAGYPLGIEYRVVRPDGSILWIRDRAFPISDAAGQVSRIVGIAQDITERKQVEAAIQERLKLETQLSKLAATAPGAIFAFRLRQDASFCFPYASPAIEDICGLPAEEVVKDAAGAFRLIHPGDTERVKESLQESRRTLSPWREEFRLQHPRKGEIWIEGRSSPEREPDGGILWHGFFHEVTERKRQEQERRAIESRYQTLFESAADAIMTLDANGFLDCNTATLKIFGCSNKNEFVVSHPGDLSPPVQPSGMDSKTAANQRIAEAFERGVNRFEWVHHRRNGEDFLAEVSLTAFWMGNQQVLQATVRDLTEVKKAEKQRLIMEVQLHQAQKLESIGQLAAGIAHEINTPTQYVSDNTRFLKDSFDNIANVLQTYEELFRAVKGNTITPELVARMESALEASDLGYLFEQIPAAIRETLEGVERVSKIVRAMKEFSHPGGREKSPADLNKAIESTVTVARNEWKYVADLVLDLDPELPPVPCFIGEFNQVILNLVVNASHAIGDVVKEHPGAKGAITVRTRRDGDEVEVRVTDTGTGIPEAFRPKIFEPFFTTKNVGKGTGQGLSIVYGSIVKKHGGTVKFETEVGKGTTFILRLPILPRAANSEPRPAETSPAAECVLAGAPC